MLSDVIAVYSAHPTAPLSLFARLRALDADTFARIESGRRALRVPAMRASIYMLPAKTAGLVFRATALPMAKHAWRLRYAHVSDAEYRPLRTAILRAAQAPASPREISAQVRATGKRLNTVLRYMTYEGSLLRLGSKDLRSNLLKYVATEAWAPQALAKTPSSEAMAWLAGEYLRAYGPARHSDFAWWAGITRKRAEHAFDEAGAAELSEGYWLPAADLSAFERARPSWRNAIAVLPKWDCYTMAYAGDGRQRLVPTQALDRVYDSAGNGLGVVLVAGMAAATWQMRFDKTSMIVDLDPFDPPSARVKKAIHDEFNKMARFLGAAGLALR